MNRLPLGTCLRISFEHSQQTYFLAILKLCEEDKIIDISLQLNVFKFVVKGYKKT